MSDKRDEIERTLEKVKRGTWDIEYGSSHIQQLVDDAVREARVGSVLGTMRQADAAMQAQFILSLFYSWCMKETNADRAKLSTEIDHKGGRAKLKVIAQLQTKDSNEEAPSDLDPEISELVNDNFKSLLWKDDKPNTEDGK